MSPNNTIHEQITWMLIVYEQTKGLIWSLKGIIYLPMSKMKRK